MRGGLALSSSEDDTPSASSGIIVDMRMMPSLLAGGMAAAVAFVLPAGELVAPYGVTVAPEVETTRAAGAVRVVIAAALVKPGVVASRTGLM